MDASLYGRSPAQTPALRVGLLVDGAKMARWSAEVVDHILQSGFASLELLVVNARTSGDGGEQPHHSLAYRLYQRWDQRNVDASTDPLAPVDCAARLAHVEAIQFDPVTSGSGQHLPPEAVERIRAKRLDVLIDLGFGRLRGDVLTAAKHGVWSYRHGDSDRYRGAGAYFREVFEGNPESGAVLRVLREEPGGGKILYQGLFATHEGLSHARNRVQPYWGGSTFVIQKLRELHAHGWEYVESRAVVPGPCALRKANDASPTNAQMLHWLAPALAGKVWHRLLGRPMVRHWRIAIRVGAAPVPASGPAPDMRGFQWVDSPRGRCYADPFVVESEGRHWVYFEDYDYRSRIGRISCAEVLDGRLGQRLTALEGPHHVSYPCVFRDRGDWYMIPETVSIGAVNLYRCTRFPDRWQMERELARGSIVDTTIWIEDGVYWFFVTYIDPRGGAAQLWLFSAPALDAAWRPHPANPISTDVRYSRGGGAIFRHDGKLYRPSQDGRVEYGRSTIFNEILVLDLERYREEPRIVVDPELIAGLVGTHTYSRAGPVELIDGKMRLPARQVI